MKTHPSSARRLKIKIKEIEYKQKVTVKTKRCPVCGTPTKELTGCCDGRDDWDAKNWQTEDDPRTVELDYGD